MSIFKDIVKWVKGWRLDKIVSSTSQPDIPVQEAAQKASDFLIKVQGFINGDGAGILEFLLGDDYQEIIDKANELIPEIVIHLEDIQIIPDIAEKLQDYKFSDDPEKDKLYHDIVTSAALIFSDGKLSISDAAIALQLLSSFKK